MMQFVNFVIIVNKNCDITEIGVKNHNQIINKMPLVTSIFPKGTHLKDVNLIKKEEKEQKELEDF